MGFFSWIAKKLSGSCHEECHSYYKKTSNQMRGKKRVAKHFAEECLVLGQDQRMTQKELAQIWNEWVTQPKNKKKYNSFDPDKTRGLVQGILANNPGEIICLYGDKRGHIVYQGIGKKQGV